MAETNVMAREATTATDGQGIPPPKVVMQTTRLGQKKRKINPAIIVAAIALLAIAFWYLFLRAPAKAPLVVRYSAVDIGEISKGVTATGTLQAVTTVQVGSQIAGTVKELYADFNTRVRKGQVLAQLDPATYEAQVTSATANLAKAQADLDAAQKDEARQRQLLARQLIAQADYDVSKNKLQDAQATVKQMAAALDQSKVNLGYTTIKSPVDGVVQARNVDKGQTVAAGLNVTTMFVIAEDLTKMQVSANVDEADIGQVQPGQDVKFTVDAYPGEQFTGTVTQVRINPITQQNVVTYAVIINTDNPDEKLLPGMTATVTIINASRENVLRVPIAATRFIPPPEFFTEMHLTDTAGARQHRQRTPGDTTHHRMGAMGSGAGGGQPQFATVYVKSKSKSGPQVQRVRIVEGLTDANNAEVLRSTPPLQPGDSVVVAAFSMQPAASQGSSPINSRPGFGGGRGR